MRAPLSLPEPTLARVVLALIAASFAGLAIGIVIGYAGRYPLPFFCGALAVVLASMRLHFPGGRVAGMAVDAVQLVREAA